jgi:hypothetical protein
MYERLCVCYLLCRIISVFSAQCAAKLIHRERTKGPAHPFLMFALPYWAQSLLGILSWSGIFGSAGYILSLQTTEYTRTAATIAAAIPLAFAFVSYFIVHALYGFYLVMSTIAQSMLRGPPLLFIVTLWTVGFPTFMTGVTWIVLHIQSWKTQNDVDNEDAEAGSPQFTPVPSSAASSASDSDEDAAAGAATEHVAILSSETAPVCADEIIQESESDVSIDSETFVVE